MNIPALTSSINMINTEISLPEIVISDTPAVKVWARLRKINYDLYDRTIEFECEVYTLVKSSQVQTIAADRITVSNATYRRKIVDSAGNPVLVGGVQADIGNFDAAHKEYVEQSGLKAAIEAAMMAKFQGTTNPLPPYVQPAKSVLP